MNDDVCDDCRTMRNNYARLRASTVCREETRNMLCDQCKIRGFRERAEKAERRLALAEAALVAADKLGVFKCSTPDDMEATCEACQVWQEYKAARAKTKEKS